jgi:integrase/recombinase XerD
MKIDIHNYAKQAQQALLRVDTCETSQRNKDLIKQFINQGIAEGKSMARICKYTNVLNVVAKWLNKDFDQAGKPDIMALVTKLQMNPEYSPWTKVDYKVIIRLFYKWLKPQDDPKEYPPEVKWISIMIKRCERRLPGQGELLTEEDIKALLNVAKNHRDRALISMLWESGCRIGELCSLRMNNIEIDKYGLLITVQGKTGSRKIRLIASTEYLMTWLKVHPLKADNTSPLWVNTGNINRNQPMTYRNLDIQLKNYFKTAGINKRCHPHIFRHSRATYMANHLTEFQMNQYFGWVQGSGMPSTYVHMSGREVDSAILALNGVKNADKKGNDMLLRPKQCPRCEAINSYDSKYCSKCAGVLDPHEAMELQTRYEENSKRLNETDDLLDKLSKNPEIIKILAQKLQEAGKVEKNIVA